MIEQRLSGILLHISSLPGPFGIGDLGSSAYEFVDFLCASGHLCGRFYRSIRSWKDPISARTALFPPSLLIFADQPREIVGERILEPGDLEQYPRLPGEVVDFPKVVIAKANLLRRAFERFRRKADEAEKEAFRRFCDSKKWLPGYAAYVTRNSVNGKVYSGERKRGEVAARLDLS